MLNGTRSVGSEVRLRDQLSSSTRRALGWLTIPETALLGVHAAAAAAHLGFGPTTDLAVIGLSASAAAISKVASFAGRNSDRAPLNYRSDQYADYTGAAYSGSGANVGYREGRPRMTVDPVAERVYRTADVPGYQRADGYSRPQQYGAPRDDYYDHGGE